jgi:DNA polymerase-3 subunit epsilon
MRELDSVDHIVCPTPLEAEVTELRLIHAHRPRYNRRSRPPKTSHWVKLTDEAYPRLSVVRTLRSDALAYLGPFRSKTAADLVVAALWDATLIRRCNTRPGSRTGRCAPAQMGVASCPCDGTLDRAVYRRVVDHLIEGMALRPSALLEPLVARMAQLSSEHRYEEAAWARDRHDALARAIETARSWAALNGLGVAELEGSDGCHIVIDHGHLVCSWAEGSSPPLRPAPDQGEHRSEGVPDSVENAEEARLIWTWMQANAIRIVDSSGTLALPAEQVVRLERRSGR